MGRCTILEGVHQEAELSLCTLLGKAQYLEHLLLKVGVMDTERTATDFDTIADEVISLGTHALGMFIQERNIIRVGHREGMVGCHETLLLF